MNSVNLTQAKRHLRKADPVMARLIGLHRPDVLPLGDLALRKSFQRLYRLADNTDDDAYLEIASLWRPYRTVASRYLWAALG